MAARGNRRLLLEHLERRLLLAADWQNSVNPRDVSDDGLVTPIDALEVINELNLRRISDEQGRLPPRPSDSPPGKLVDTTGDGFVSPRDALLVINALNGDSEPPTIVARLLADTAPRGTFNSDGVTFTATLVGQVHDALTGVAWLQAQVDSGPLVSVTYDQRQGQFTFDPRLESGGLADGEHTVRFQAWDAFGNVSPLTDVSFTLDTHAPIPPALALSLTSALGEVDDGTTNARRVTLVGQTDPNITVTLATLNRSALSSSSGRFQFPGITLDVGDTLLAAEAHDVAGNASTFQTTLHRVESAGERDPVLFWNQAALEAIRRDATTPPVATRNLALLQAAVYDVVSNLEGTPSYFAVLPPPTGTSPVAAVSAAAHRVLAHLYPGQAVALDAELIAALADVPEGSAKTAGLQFGTTVGELVLALRAGDGWDTFVDAVPGSGPGAWQPTGPMYDVPLLPQWGDLPPFAVINADPLRPAGPPALASQVYADALNEVRLLGSATSSTRTAEQTEIARFWADGAGTYTPPGHWNQIATQVALAQGNSLSENARLFAQLDLALADAAILAWKAKYDAALWRPIAAIRAADTDGNDLTTVDRQWTPLLVTPPFPEYVSAHSAFSGAAAEILSQVFGNQVSFTTDSLSLPGVERSFTNFQQAADEASRSRIYGGIHYSFSSLDGLDAGRAIAQQVLQSFSVSSDVTPPRIVIEQPETGLVTKTNIVVQGRMLDNLSGAQTLEVQLDNGSFAAVSWSAAGQFSLPTQFTLDGAADGAHVFRLRGTDAAGNVSPPEEFSFTLDTRAPQVVIDTPVNADNVDAATLLSGVAHGTGSPITRLTYRIDAGAVMPVRFDPATGRFDQSLDLSRLAVGPHTLVVTALDAAGHETIVNRSINLPTASWFGISALTPGDGAQDVGTTFRPQVFFSRPVDPTSLTSSNFFATGPSGTKLPARIVTAQDGSFAWLFFADPMPGGAQITLHVDGATTRAAADGAPLDADRDGAAGGWLETTFRTVSRTPLLGTSLSGKVVDPGPDLSPMTFDDIRAGADGILHTADDVFLSPLAGVKVFILGMDVPAVLTDAAGNFHFDAVPAGNVKLALDGRTATNAPAGFYFPEMVMDLNLRAGQANTAMGAMGTLAQQQANADRAEVYLPRLRTDILQPLSATEPTVITLDPASAPGLTPAQRSQLTITVQPGTLIGHDGQPVAGGEIGISTVPPQLVRDMLPPGLLQHTFDITVQAPGIDRFATPAPLTFPNVFHAAPGTQLNFLSFDHTTGRLVIEGSATVSADGLSVHTDPGTGITHPGWHGLTPQGSPSGPAAPRPPAVCIAQPTGDLPGDGESPPGELHFEFNSMSRSGSGSFVDTLDFLFTSSVGEGLLQFSNPQPISPCFPDEGELLIDVTVNDKDAAQFLGGLRTASFFLRPQSTQRIPFQPRVFSAKEFKKFAGDQLYGVQVTIEVHRRNRDGTFSLVADTPEPFYVYRYVEAADDHADDSQLKLNDTLNDGAGGVTRQRQWTYRGGAAALPEMRPNSPAGDFQVHEVAAPVGKLRTFNLVFDPRQTKDALTAVMLIIPPRSGAVQPASGPGQLIALANAIAPLTVYLDYAGYESALAAVVANPLNTLTQNQRDMLATPELRRGFFERVSQETQLFFAPFGDAITFSHETPSSDPALFSVEWVTRSPGHYAEFPAPGWTAMNAFLKSDRAALNEHQSNFQLGKILSDARRNPADHRGTVFIPEFFYTHSTDHFDADADRLIYDISSTLAHELCHGLEAPHISHIVSYTGTDEVQEFAVNAGVSSFTLTLGGASASFPATVRAATIQAALRALPGFSNSRLIVSGPDGGPYQIHYVPPAHAFRRFFAAVDMPLIQGTGITPRTLVNGSFHPVIGREIVIEGARGRNDLMHSEGIFPDLKFLPQLSQSILSLSLGTGWGPHEARRALTIFTRAAARGDLKIPATGGRPEEEFVLDGPGLAVLDADGLLAPQEIDFGTVEIGAGGAGASIRRLTLLNYGSEDVIVRSVSITQGFDRFSVPAIPVTTLRPGDTFDIDISFTPDLDIVSGGILSVDADALGSGYELDLTGSGQRADEPEIHVDFFNNIGGAIVGRPTTFAAKPLIVNQGTQPLTISEIRVAAGQGQDEYSFIEQTPLPITLQPGEGMQLIHVFRPSQVGLRPGAFEIVSDDPDTPVYRLPIVGTGVLTEDFLTYGGVDLGNDFVAAEDGFGNFFANNLPTLRTRSDDGGNWEFFLPAQTAIHVATFDPVSGLIAHGGGRTSAAGQRTGFNIGVFEPSRYPDSDNDGLPDDIEFAIGTSPSEHDTDGDGQSDFVEIDNGQNPLDDRPAVSGIVSALATDGAVRDVILAADFNEPTRKLAYLAIGTAGMAIVDVTDFARPTLISQLALPVSSTSNREIRKISLDVQRKLLAAASPTGGVHVLDVADPTQPRIELTMAHSGADPVAALELFDGQIFIAAGGEVRSHNVVTGDSDGTFELGHQRVLGMSRRGYHLFVTLEDLTVGEKQLRILAITPTGLVGLGAVSLPNVDGLGDPFLDDEVAWIPGFDRVITVDIKALEAPRLLAGTLGLNQTLVSAISLNGSGLGVIAGAQPNGTAIILQTGNPLDVTRIFTRFALPSLGEAVALSSGLAYLADGASGLQVLSFLAYDQGTTPPTIIVEPIPGDVDPGQIGLQFVEMSTVVIPAQIRDDTQVRSVELLVDGTVVRTELSYPYDLSTVLPRVVNTGREVVLQIRATDTGGNVRLSDPIVIELVPDVTSPSIDSLDPPHGSTQPVSRRRVRVQFSEPLDRATAVAANFVLRGPGGEVVPLSLQLRQRDSLVEILYPPLAEGDYQFITHTAAVTDRVGNALAATDLTSTFRVASITRQPTIRWTNEAGGSWDVAGNWLDVATQSPRLPVVTDDVLIDVPGDALVTFGSGTVQVNSIVSAERFQVTGGLLDVSETIQVNNTFLLRGTASTSVATLRGTVLRGSGGEGVTIAGHSRLDGATLQTDVTINEANTKLRVQNGLALLGTATISALNVAIGFEGTQTVAAGTFTTGQAAQSAANMHLTAIGTATITFGADVVIRGAGSLYSNPTAFQSNSELRVVNYGTIAASGPQLNRFYTGSESLINHGLIAAELESQLALDDKTWTNAADGRIVIGNASPPIGSARVIQGVLGADQSRSWTNAGTIEMFNTNVYFMSGTPRTSTWSNAGTLLVNNTSLNLGGTFTSDDVRNVRQTGSFIGITGLMDNTGRTFTFTSENGNYYLSQLGWIKEGTIVSTGPNSRLEFVASGTLDGVTLVGDYRLGGLHDFAEGSQGILQAQPNVVNGLTLDGTMQIFHSQTNRLWFNGPQTISGGTYQLMVDPAWSGGGGDGDGIFAFQGGPVIIDSSVTIRTSSGFGGGLFGHITSSATVITDAASAIHLGGEFHPNPLLARPFVNRGPVAVSPGATVTLGDVFTNEAPIVVDQGTLRAKAIGTWKNLSTIDLTNQGTLIMGWDTSIARASMRTADLGTVHDSGGRVILTDNLLLDNSGNTLVVDGTTDWTLDRAVIDGGVIQVADTAKLRTARFGGWFKDVRIEGNVAVNGILSLVGDVTILGTIAPERTNSDVFLSLGDRDRYPNVPTIIHSGTIEVQSLIDGSRSSGAVTLEPGVILRGRATDATLTGAVLNRGLIESAAINPFTSGDLFHFTIAPITNQGTLSAVDRSVLRIANLAAPNEGTISASNGGTVSFTGSFAQADAGQVSILVGGTAAREFGHVTTASSATLAGTLSVTFTNGFTPAAGDRFQVLEYDTRIGTFGTIQVANLPANLVVVPEYNATNLTLVIHALGHVLGYDHEGEGMMAETSTAGVRLTDGNQHHVALVDRVFSQWRSGLERT